METIYIAGGCFWGVEEYYRRLKGVEKTEVGYANGRIENPTYEQVCHYDTGFAETVKVEFDPNIISLDQILNHFFRIVNPTTLNKQGNDIGTQYRSGIFYLNDTQKDIIQDYINKEQVNYDKPIVVENVPLINYYPAENYHQDYLVKNPGGYCHVNFGHIKPEEAK